MPAPLVGMLLAALPALLGGGAAVAGSAMQNASAKKRAQEQMDFQERMSSTSYQRSMEDMKQSGLNPMLAFQQGGASSPGGAMPQTENLLGTAMSSAIAAQRGSEELKMLKFDREHQKRSWEYDIGLKTAEGERLTAQKKLFDEEYEGVRLENSARRMSLPGLRNEERVDKSWVGKVAPFVDRVRDTLLPFLMLGRQGGPFGAKFGSKGSSIRGRY